MQIITHENFNVYSKDIKNLITYFKKTDEKTQIVMNKLQGFIKNGNAIVSGHIVNNEMVSLIWCYERIYNDIKRLHISYFIVKDSYRGKGFAKELLKFSEQTARKLNIKYIDLNVSPNNENAIKLYEKSGFFIEKHQFIMKVDEDKNYV